MDYVVEMLREGWRLLHHDPYLGGLTVRTIRLALEATALALVLGLPLACAIALRGGRAARWARLVASAGVGLPPVAIGVLGVLLLAGHEAPWGGTWLNTLNGMVLAQLVLALPVVVALTAAAIDALDPGLLAQARALGASGWRLGVFALREARLGVLAGTLVALGSALGEVGAVALIGGNGTGATATLAGQMVNDARAVNTPAAVEHAMALMALVLALGLGYVLVDRAQRAPARRRPQSGLLG